MLPNGLPVQGRAVGGLGVGVADLFGKSSSLRRWVSARSLCYRRRSDRLQMLRGAGEQLRPQGRKTGQNPREKVYLQLTAGEYRLLPGAAGWPFGRRLG